MVHPDRIQRALSTVGTAGQTRQEVTRVERRAHPIRPRLDHVT